MTYLNTIKYCSVLLGIMTFTLASAFVGLGYIGLAHLEETEPERMVALGGFTLWYDLGIILVIFLAANVIIILLVYLDSMIKPKKAQV